MKNTIFDKDDAENGKMIETKNARNGGYLVGRSHKNGGIKGVNVDTGDPIEVEGGEVVITKPAVESNKYYTLNGKKMKPKEKDIFMSETVILLLWSEVQMMIWIMNFIGFLGAKNLLMEK
jgi:hypothetical protein